MNIVDKHISDIEYETKLEAIDLNAGIGEGQSGFITENGQSIYKTADGSSIYFYTPDNGNPVFNEITASILTSNQIETVTLNATTRITSNALKLTQLQNGILSVDGNGNVKIYDDGAIPVSGPKNSVLRMEVNDGTYSGSDNLIIDDNNSEVIFKNNAKAMKGDNSLLSRPTIKSSSINNSNIDIEVSTIKDSVLTYDVQSVNNFTQNIRFRDTVSTGEPENGLVFQILLQNNTVDEVTFVLSSEDNNEIKYLGGDPSELAYIPGGEEVIVMAQFILNKWVIITTVGEAIAPIWQTDDTTISPINAETSISLDNGKIELKPYEIINHYTDPSGWKLDPNALNIKNSNTNFATYSVSSINIEDNDGAKVNIYSSQLQLVSPGTDRGETILWNGTNSCYWQVKTKVNEGIIQFDDASNKWSATDGNGTYDLFQPSSTLWETFQDSGVDAGAKLINENTTGIIGDPNTLDKSWLKFDVAGSGYIPTPTFGVEDNMQVGGDVLIGLSDDSTDLYTKITTNASTYPVLYLHDKNNKYLQLETKSSSASISTDLSQIDFYATAAVKFEFKSTGINIPSGTNFMIDDTPINANQFWIEDGTRQIRYYDAADPTKFTNIGIGTATIKNSSTSQSTISSEDNSFIFKSASIQIASNLYTLNDVLKYSTANKSSYLNIGTDGFAFYVSDTTGVEDASIDANDFKCSVRMPARGGMKIGQLLNTPYVGSGYSLIYTDSSLKTTNNEFIPYIVPGNFNQVYPLSTFRKDAYGVKSGLGNAGAADDILYSISSDTPYIGIQSGALLYEIAPDIVRGIIMGNNRIYSAKTDADFIEEDDFIITKGAYYTGFNNAYRLKSSDNIDGNNYYYAYQFKMNGEGVYFNYDYTKDNYLLGFTHNMLSIEPTNGTTVTNSLNIKEFTTTPVSIADGGKFYVKDDGNAYFLNQNNIEYKINGSNILSGGTSSRPSTTEVGLNYFDTDLGYPIWFDGTNWVNATGAIV